MLFAENQNKSIAVALGAIEQNDQRTISMKSEHQDLMVRRSKNHI
jgi:hypothetical protein